MIIKILKVAVFIFLALVVLGILCQIVLFLVEVVKFVFALIQFVFSVFSIIWNLNIFFPILSFTLWHFKNTDRYSHFFEKGMMYDASLYLFLCVGLALTILKIVVVRSGILFRIPLISNLYTWFLDRREEQALAYHREKVAAQKAAFEEIRAKELELVKPNFQK